MNLAHLSRFDSESTTPLDGWFENAVTQYNEILRECGINHSDVDYISVKIESIKTGGFKIGSRISHRISQMSQEMSALFIVSLIVFAFVMLVCGFAFSQIIDSPGLRHKADIKENSGGITDSKSTPSN